LDSFLCGFTLAWKLANELDNLENRRFTLTDEVERSARFASKEGEFVIKR